MAVRWATTGVSVALASPELLDSIAVLDLGRCRAGQHRGRDLQPLRYTGSTRASPPCSARSAYIVLAVIATGYWDSPLVLLLINAVIIAGFARGFGFAVGVGGRSTLAVSLPG